MLGLLARYATQFETMNGCGGVEAPGPPVRGGVDSGVSAVLGTRFDEATSQSAPGGSTVTPEEQYTYWETARWVARSSIDAAMWVAPLATTTARFGTQVFCAYNLRGPHDWR